VFNPLDGPSIQGVISVGVGAVVEAKVGASVFTDRKVITIQPVGKLYVLFADEGVVPSIADLSTKGFLHFKNQKDTYEAGEKQKVYLLSFSGTIDVKIAERA
jgi:hypothetical protein